MRSIKSPQNLIEKIVQRYAVSEQQLVCSGQFVTIQPHHVMTHDNTAAVMNKFKAIGCQSFNNPRQPVFTLDHDIQNKSEKNIEKYSNIQEFARRHGVDFYPAGRGIGHQVMIEEGYAFPQTLTVASDSHTNMYGGIGALGTPIVRTDAAAIWATGKTWWQIPPVVKVELSGSLPEGLCGKDVIVALCGLFNRDDVLNCALEFDGSAVSSLSIDDRLTIANMTTEWGALAGVFPVDDRTLEWLSNRVGFYEREFKRLNGKFPNAETVPSLSSGQPQHPRLNRERIEELSRNILTADPDAHYSKHLKLDLSTLRDSFVAGPNSVKNATPLFMLESQNISINKAYLLSCTNSRSSDIKQAADVFRQAAADKRLAKVASGVELYLAAASSQVEEEAKAAGDWQVLIDAGAKPLPAGCGPCIGLGVGLLKDGETGISATNRNFRGRMGSRDANVYLASPALVASSAIAGKIQGLKRGDETLCSHTMEPQAETVNIFGDYHLKANTDKTPTLPQFPKSIQGEIIFCPVDNLNTDGIYPGKYTYREDLTPAEMGKVVMENYDQNFSQIVQKGDILVSGANFGSGSSREQAATALKYAGIQLVIAKSFSETFKRNSLNNALLCLESKDFVYELEQLLSVKSNSSKSIRTGVFIKVSFEDQSLRIINRPLDNKFRIPSVGRIAQELVIAGGLEQWVSSQQQQ